MTPTQHLRAQGQSIWLDNISRDLLDDGSLQRLIDQSDVTGLTSNPTIFARALQTSAAYAQDIRSSRAAGLSDEAIFFELALADLRRAADLLRPVFDASDGLDGWVSLEVSPLLAHDADGSLAAALDLHARAGRPNLLIKIPGTTEGLHAIEAAIFAGVPVNVTLLFSQQQYLAVAHAYLSAIERRITNGLDPRVDSVASVFVSRWDTAAAQKLAANWSQTAGANPVQEPPFGRSWTSKSQGVYLNPTPARESACLATSNLPHGLTNHCTMSDPEHRGGSTATTGSWQTSTAPAVCGPIHADDAAIPGQLRNQLGLAVARQTYCAYLDLLASTRWQQAAAAGARMQRLLWASTGVKDPTVRDVLYVEALIADQTINTMPDATLRAFADHGVATGTMPADGGDYTAVLERFGRAGIDVHSLAQQLQDEGLVAFEQSWQQLLQRIADIQ